MPARRLIAIVLSAALAMAVAVRPIVVSGSMDVVSTTTIDMGAMDMPMHGKCNGCAGHEKSIASTVCSVLCSATAALPFATVVHDPLIADALVPRAVLVATGIDAAPDPYPPRPPGMS